MKSTRRMHWSPLARTSLMFGVLFCLCFSAGEGLRLTPLPLEEVAASELQATLARATDLNQTGPLDVPAQGQTQKRGKRQTPECEGPPASSAHEIPVYLLRRPGDSRQLILCTRLLESRPPGRAPPHAS